LCIQSSSLTIQLQKSQEFFYTYLPNLWQFLHSFLIENRILIENVNELFFLSKMVFAIQQQQLILIQANKKSFKNFYLYSLNYMAFFEKSTNKLFFM